MRIEDRRLPGSGIPQTLFELTSCVESSVRRRFRGTGLHWGLRRIMQRLWIQDGLSQRELSDSVGSSEASISNMLKHLVAGEWVERRQDAFDYRISRVYLTDKGRHLREAVERDLDALDRAIRSEQGHAEADRLEAMLECVGSVLLRHLAPLDARETSQQGDCPSPPGEL